MKYKKILVFGGSGFLGTYVVNELLNRNYEVISADISPPLCFDKKQFRKCDILDQNAVDTIIAHDIDVVYNFAGFANLDNAVFHPRETMNLNVMGNLNILEACKKKKIKRLVYASSSYAINDKGSFYGISKLASEKIIEEYRKRYGLKFTIIRYGSLYSEREAENNHLYSVIKEAVEKRKIIYKGDGEEIREYIHTVDAAKLSVDIIESRTYENQHILLTGVERMRRRELFEMVKEILNDEIEIVYEKKGNQNHYKVTPYCFQPTISRKLVANPYIDMGQGLLECVKAIYGNNNRDILAN
ncbi:MAG: NAD-dependent epimerase/dehydratase family protein [bacterium]|nr:NAD-dependent epimerase/dehydratase family protein [bacterium]